MNESANTSSVSLFQGLFTALKDTSTPHRKVGIIGGNKPGKSANIHEQIGRGTIESGISDISQTGKIKALNTLAKFFATQPYTAVIEDIGNKNYYLSTSNVIKDWKSIIDNLCTEKINLNKLCEDMILNKNPIMYSRLIAIEQKCQTPQIQEFMKYWERDNSEEKQKALNDLIGLEDVQKLFAEEIKKIEHLDKKAIKEMQLISTSNIKHVEMQGIAEIKKLNPEAKKFNVGLAKGDDKNPGCCAGCSAEKKALESMSEGFKLEINVENLMPQNFPPGNYAPSDNIKYHLAVKKYMECYIKQMKENFNTLEEAKATGPKVMQVSGKRTIRDYDNPIITEELKQASINLTNQIKEFESKLKEFNLEYNKIGPEIEKRRKLNSQVKSIENIQKRIRSNSVDIGLKDQNQIADLKKIKNRSGSVILKRHLSKESLFRSIDQSIRIKLRNFERIIIKLF